MSMSMMSGMDMGMDNSTMTTSMGTAFTTVIGSSNLWFNNWTPTTIASTLGACIGLFFLSISARLLSAFKSTLEISWAQSIALSRSLAQLHSYNSTTSIDSISKSNSNEATPSTPPILLSTTKQTQSTCTRAPPFIPSIDIPRALIFMIQAFIGYLLMLAIMTFNTYFFIAIILGFGVGELSFGRFISHGGNGGDGVHL